MPSDWESKRREYDERKTGRSDWASKRRQYDRGDLRKSSGGGGGLLGSVGRLGGKVLTGTLDVLDKPRQGVDALLGDFDDDLRGDGKGVGGFLRSLAVDVATDPLTYVTLGTAGAAKAGLKTAAKSLGQETAEQVAKKGTRVLSTGQRATLTKALKETRGDKAAASVLRKMDRGAAGGVKIGGRTVVPAAALGGRGGAATNLGRRISAAKPIAAITPRSTIAAKHGQDIADDLGAMAARRRAAASRGQAVGHDRLAAIGPRFNLHEDDLRTLDEALDIGGAQVPLEPRLAGAADEFRSLRSDLFERQVAEGLIDSPEVYQGRLVERATKGTDAKLAEVDELLERVGRQGTTARARADELAAAAPRPIQANGTRRLEQAAMRVQASRARLAQAQAKADVAEEAIARRAMAEAEEELRGSVIATRATAERAAKLEAADEIARQHDDLLREYGGQIRIPKKGDPNYGEWQAFKTAAGLEARKGRFRNPLIRRQDGSTYRLFSISGLGSGFNDIDSDELAQRLRFIDELRRGGRATSTADEFTGLATSGTVDEAMENLRHAFGDDLAEAGDEALARTYEGIDAERALEATRGAAKLTPAERAIARPVAAAGRTRVAEGKLAKARTETIAKLTERGRSVGRKEGEALGKAEQRARILENTKRSAEARKARLTAKRVEKEAGARARAIDPEEYVPREFTPKGMEALKKRPDIAERFGIAPNELKRAFEQGGHLRERKLMPNASAREVEEKIGGLLRKEGVLDDDLLVHNPMTKWGNRVSQAERAIAEKRFLDDMVAYKTPDGAPLMLRAGKDVKRPHGWVEIGDDRTGRFFAPSEIASEVERVQAVVTNDDALREFNGLLGRLNTLWKGYATVPVIGGFGFHLRNAQGNVWNNFLAGVKNPLHYTRATKIQVALARGRKLSPADDRIVKLAQREGVLEEGFFLTDLADPHSKGGKLARAVKGGKLPRRLKGGTLDPRSTENVAIRSGRRVGSAIEGNARLAHFIAKYDELGDASEAAQSVKKYLFDYGDLTPSERRFKRYIAFWTFMRKNTPLQIQELFRQPGKFAGVAHAHKRAWEGKDKGEFPEWAVEEGMVPVGGGDLMVGLDLPLKAAIQQLDPSEQADFGVFGGFLPALVKAGIEDRTKTSLYTGGRLQGSRPQRFGEAAVPLLGKIRRMPGAHRLPTGAGIGLNTDNPDQEQARRIAALTGLMVRNTRNDR